jgi:hypothetical protein
MSVKNVDYDKGISDIEISIDLLLGGSRSPLLIFVEGGKRRRRHDDMRVSVGQLACPSR